MTNPIEKEKKIEFKIRDLLAIPFMYLMFLFARITLEVGGVFTAKEMLKTFKDVTNLQPKDEK